MAGAYLTQVDTQVAQSQDDIATVVSDAVALITYAASTYATDDQLRQLVDNINADANVAQQGLLLLTTEVVDPPNLKHIA